MRTSHYVRRTSEVLDRAVSGLTLVFAWVALLALIAMTVVNVVARRALGVSWPVLYELGAEVFFALVMLSFGYGYLRDGHVRVDIVRERMPARWLAWIELFGCLGIVMPLSVYLIDYGARSAALSFAQGARGAALDLPYEAVVKAAVPVGFLLLLIAAIVVVIRSARFLAARTGAPAPPSDT
jgi:TRAP-type mannitol/chloroaromatic compound transport system permease small subunit